MSGVISSEAIGQSFYSRKCRIGFHHLVQPILLIVNGLSFQWHYFWICTSFSLFQPLILLFCLVMWHPWKSWLWLTVPLDDLLLGNTHVLSIQIPCWLIWLCLRFMIQVLVFVDQVQLRCEAHATQQEELQEFTNSVYDQLPPDFLSSVQLVWLCCLPLKFHW